MDGAATVTQGINMSTFVLFQKQIHPEGDVIPAREVHVIAETKPLLIEKEAMALIRVGYRPYLIKFTELPPSHLVTTACEEAVRNKTVHALPLATTETRRTASYGHTVKGRGLK